MMSGVVYSECFTPMEKAGALFLCMVTRSGVCEPGPGLCVLSERTGVGKLEKEGEGRKGRVLRFEEGRAQIGAKRRHESSVTVT